MTIYKRGTEVLKKTQISQGRCWEMKTLVSDEVASPEASQVLENAISLLHSRKKDEGESTSSLCKGAFQRGYEFSPGMA